jgi:hypothetical protein
VTDSLEVFDLVESTRVGHRIRGPKFVNHCDGAFRPNNPSNSTACVEIIAGDPGQGGVAAIAIDCTLPHKGKVNADAGGVAGFQGTSRIDIFARSAIQIISDSAVPFAVTPTACRAPMTMVAS